MSVSIVSTSKLNPMQLSQTHIPIYTQDLTRINFCMLILTTLMNIIQYKLIVTITKFYLNAVFVFCDKNTVPTLLHYRRQSEMLTQGRLGLLIYAVDANSDATICTLPGYCHLLWYTEGHRCRRIQCSCLFMDLEPKQNKRKGTNGTHACLTWVRTNNNKKSPKPNKQQKSSMSSSVKSVSGSAGLMTWARQVEALQAMQRQYKCHRYIEIHQ